ncbi:hypothetical protein EIJ81_09060 [Aliivibrio salmonicida]|uniref:Uncharacterized protein n=1 Tax=Aliivibrio salmonicida (strain LFI1238) TaxID=316275 RepID=B6EKW9_ALISL|nr:hypothetical protein [Aliivibrio salmonicida]AZL84741.1 hypothetical protein EIJ81_09060 [Aliivibrio salmonicida]CAQ79142.1 hypothetical protein VSAL_I1457 [Aliivibrio salmonicida LFI1238]
MTSIVCWRNAEQEKSPAWVMWDGLWAVSDTRVSDSGSVMTDNCPKVTSISAFTYKNSDIHRSNPKCLFRFGFGFAGSTLIGSNVREILSTFVGNLSEVHYYDQPDYPYEDKLPSLMEISELCKKLGEKYISSLGFSFPRRVGCEFLIFGCCPKTKEYRTIMLRNSPDNPAVLNIIEKSLNDTEYLVLGDQKERVATKIEAIKHQLVSKGKQVRNAPIYALESILEEDNGTIGGFLQLCISTVVDTKQFFISTDKNDKNNYQVAGFSLMSELSILGGFSVSMPGGLSIPRLVE